MSPLSLCPLHWRTRDGIIRQSEVVRAERKGGMSDTCASDVPFRPRISMTAGLLACRSLGLMGLSL